MDVRTRGGIRGTPSRCGRTVTSDFRCSVRRQSLHRILEVSGGSTTKNLCRHPSTHAGLRASRILRTLQHIAVKQRAERREKQTFNNNNTNNNTAEHQHRDSTTPTTSNTTCNISLLPRRMLAHLKGKRRNSDTTSALTNQVRPTGIATATTEPQQQHQRSHTVVSTDSSIMSDPDATQMTCDVLCSLSSSVSQPPRLSSSTSIISNTSNKQHQLPMFLSKTYHMIDRCDHTIATWSERGDNFVVKNVEKFATTVLPLYFKHSNFSSFARQLNFYGFRKLRTDPILTSDVDPNTACHVRFYHEHFQKDKPQLLHMIKRATKSDQQSKDDMEVLKGEVTRLRDCVGQMQTDFERRLAELSYECNRRITAMSAEYDKLVAVVQQLLPGSSLPPSLGAHLQLQHTVGSSALAASAPTSTGSMPPTLAVAAASHPHAPDLMQSLSQAASLTLQQQEQEQAAASSKKRSLDTSSSSSCDAKLARTAQGV